MSEEVTSPLGDNIGTPTIVEINGQLTQIYGGAYEAFMNKNVLITCMRYTYHGKLIAISSHTLTLDQVEYVFDTGELVGSTAWAVSSPSLTPVMIINIGAIENVCESGRDLVNLPKK